MDIISYLGKNYKVRTFHVDVTGHDHKATYMIADEGLNDAMSEARGIDDNDFELGSMEQKIDDEIYHYVEVGVLELDGEEICAKHLDIPMKLINEVTY